MRQTTKIRRADIEKAAQFFDEAPQMEPDEVTRKEAIRILAPKIRAMRRKGYTWAKIAEVLATFGIAIEADLLVSYYRAAGEAPAASGKRARRAMQASNSPASPASVTRDAAPASGQAGAPVGGSAVAADASSTGEGLNRLGPGNGAGATRPAAKPKANPGAGGGSDK